MAKTKIRPTPSDYPDPSGDYGKMPTVVYRDYGNGIQTWHVHARNKLNKCLTDNLMVGLSYTDA